MSFLRWFGKKESGRDTAPEQSSDLSQVDVTLPINRLMHLQLPQDKNADVNSRRSERLERRELLYGVVRESMTAAGVLSSTYKFKVLSLDSSGRKYLIMVDMPREYLVNTAYFAETEGAIARSAKERYDILITAVYWRVNDMVSAAGQSVPRPLARASAPTEDANAATTLPAPIARNEFAELQKEEVLAFKRAVAEAAASGTSRPRNETRRSGRRGSESELDFSNTEPFEPSAPLGPSQFGGLN